jgi:transcriptional regulator with XRE-family HTH domain
MIRLDRRAELADFLRTRRERLDPAAVGLKPGPRRRARGLRREEVAELAGISTAWYTWLEQGRQINPSQKVLDALARALKLQPHEFEHLIQLAQPAPPAQFTPERVPAPLKRMLRGYRWAAYVIGRRWDLLAWNDRARELFIDFEKSPERERNILRYMFLDPRAKRLFVDWEVHARRMVAQFRSNVARYAEEPRFAELVSALRRGSPAFNTWWTDHHIELRGPGTVVVRHPKTGELRAEFATFQADDMPGARLVMYVPAENDS